MVLENILVNVPDNRSIKEIEHKLETVTTQIALDIGLPTQRLKFSIKNSREEVDYVLNPHESDLTANNTAD